MLIRSKITDFVGANSPGLLIGIVGSDARTGAFAPNRRFLTTYWRKLFLARRQRKTGAF